MAGVARRRAHLGRIAEPIHTIENHFALPYTHKIIRVGSIQDTTILK